MFALVLGHHAHSQHLCVPDLNGADQVQERSSRCRASSSRVLWFLVLDFMHEGLWETSKWKEIISIVLQPDDSYCNESLVVKLLRPQRSRMKGYDNAQWLHRRVKFRRQEQS